MSRFEKAAESSGISFKVTPYEDLLGQPPDLFIVHIGSSKQSLPDSQSLHETIKDLELYDGVYKRKAVDAAIGLKDEIITCSD